MPPARALLRQLQAVIGVGACTAALWSYDWRLGLGFFGLISITTSGAWRAR